MNDAVLMDGVTVPFVDRLSRLSFLDLSRLTPNLPTTVRHIQQPVLLCYFTLTANDVLTTYSGM